MATPLAGAADAVDTPRSPTPTAESNNSVDGFMEVLRRIERSPFVKS
jgi:hypothetical protein